MLNNKETVLRALEAYRGDDLYRATMAFRHCSPAEMEMQYGQSGQTRAAILRGYQEREKAIQEAIAWVKGRGGDE